MLCNQNLWPPQQYLLIRNVYHIDILGIFNRTNNKFNYEEENTYIGNGFQPVGIGTKVRQL